MTGRTWALTTLAIYLACVVSANWLTEHYGLVEVGLGLSATAGTYAAGAALFARDLLQDAAGRIAVLSAIALGGFLTYLISPSLAFASCAAFLVAELFDMAIYTPLRAHGWALAVVASNIVGAIVDTFVFLWIADFPITWETLAGQLVGKLIWATALPVAVVSAVRR